MSFKVRGRLAFSALYAPVSVLDSDRKTYGAKILVSDEEANRIREEMVRFYCERDTSSRAPIEADALIMGGRTALRCKDGSWSISARSQFKPYSLRRVEGVITEVSDLYDGCYVVADVGLWYQDDRKWGKRVNANLNGVLFVRDGERMGRRSAADMFADVVDESAEDVDAGDNGDDDLPF